MSKVSLLLLTYISEEELQFFSNGFAKIRFPLLQFIADRINHPGTILIPFMDVQSIILVTIGGNVLALNNSESIKN